MDRLKFYQDNYYKELERKNELDNSLSMPAGLLLAVCTSISYLILNFKNDGFDIISIAFIFFAILTCAFLLCAIYQLIRAYNNFTFGYNYKYLPYNNEIEEYYNDLIDNQIMKNPKATNKAITSSNQELEKYLKKIYIENADNNAYNNDRKITHLFKAKLFLIFSLISVFFLVLPYGYNYYKFKNNVIKIDVIKPIRIIK